jgi:hypothetical protein
MSTNFGIAPIIRAATEMFGRMEASRRRRGTARVLEALPENVLKDIGYRHDHSGRVTRVRNDLSR